MSERADKIKVCLTLSSNLYKKLNHEIIEKYGNIHGHIAKSMDEAIELWLEHQKKGDN